MTITEVEAELKRLGVELYVGGGRLHIRDPMKVMSIELVTAIRIHRAALLCELRHNEEWFRFHEGDYGPNDWEKLLVRQRSERERVSRGAQTRKLLRY